MAKSFPLLDFDMLEPSASINSSALSKRAVWPKNTCKYFRVVLMSNHATATSGGNTWTFQMNAPEELNPGKWHMHVQEMVMSGNTPPAGNADRIHDFYIQGIPIRDAYECTPQQDSNLLISTVRGAATVFINRPVASDHLGVVLSDVGQLRGRQITVTVRNGAGALLTDNGLTHWRAVLVFNLLDAY